MIEKKSQKSTEVHGSCNEVVKQLCESLSFSTDSPECNAIRRHLEDCEGCSNYRTSILKTIHLYKSYSVELDESSINRLLQNLNLDEGCSPNTSQ